MHDEDATQRCCLDLTLNVGPRFGEPSNYVVQYEGSILSGENFDLPVGRMSLYLADLSRAYQDGHSPWDVLDSVDSGLAHFCRLVSARTGLFKPSIARLAEAEIAPLLILGHLTVQPEHRGQGLGLSAMQVACDRLGVGCALAALKAFPSQWEGRVEEGPAVFRKDQARLIRYYRRAGFLPVVGDALMARSLSSYT